MWRQNGQNAIAAEASCSVGFFSGAKIKYWKIVTHWVMTVAVNVFSFLLIGTYYDYGVE